jgi:predicted nucleic acid-binding protein
LGVNQLRSFLRRHRRIALDTSVFIYQLENNLRYSAYTDLIFAWLERPGSRAVSSTVTMTELLVHPYRADDQKRADQIYALLSTYPNLEWIAPGLEIADLAAQFRARHGLRTQDAIHAATAAHWHATGLITNDTLLNRVDNFETLILEQLL